MERDEKTLESIKEFMGDDSIKIMDPKDTFDFQCQQCGRCCMHREDIILNPFDVYNAAKYLGITTREFIEENTVFSLGGTSRIPMVMLACDNRGWCPLLVFDVKDGGKYKCSINPAKPGACSNHPIGTIREYNKSTGAETMGYVKVAQCENSKGHNELHTVEDWCKDYVANINEIKVAHELQTCVEEYFPCRLLDFIMFVITKQSGDSLPEKFAELVPFLSTLSGMYEEFQNKYIAILYGNYDTSKPFIEQAKENKEVIVNKLFMPMKKMLVMLCKDMPDFLQEMVKSKVGPSCEAFFEEIKSINVDEDFNFDKDEEDTSND